MPAESTAPTTDLATQILQAPDELWQRLRSALNVKTRDEAVQVVNTNERAAELARSILGGGTEESVLTRPTAPLSSFLTQEAPQRNAAETVYPRRGRGRMQF